MRIAGVIVLCGLLGGCGSGIAVYAGSSPAVERARIRELLHDVPNLPDGFSGRVRDGWTAPFHVASRSCRVAFDTVAGRPPRRFLRTHAEVTFQGNGLGERAGASVASYSEDAAAGFEAIEDALRDCSAVTAGNATSLTLTSLPIAETGDAITATRLRGHLKGYPYEMHLVFVQAGEALISVVHAALGRADPLRTEQLVHAVTATMTGEAPATAAVAGATIGGGDR
ncbi:hypothetical protein [Streptosporangium sp. KLBMP 9127]|nr:hypothetical protein [Streptosporangium sp. KLBMP 9127]